MNNIFSKLKRQGFNKIRVFDQLLIIALSLGILYYGLYNIIDHSKIDKYLESLQNLQLALLTLIIPLGIELLNFSDDISENKKHDTQSLSKFKKSKNLIKEELVRKYFPIIGILIFIFIIPILEIISPIFSIIQDYDYITLCISLFVNIYLGVIIIKIFNILNNEEKTEIFYKNTLKNYNGNSDKIVGLWDSYLRNKIEFDLPNNSIIETFIKRLDNKNSVEDYKEMNNLLGVFYKHIDNRKTIPKILIDKLFEYSYNFWHQYQESTANKDNSSKSIELYEIYRISEEILIKILQKSLQDPHPVSATIDFFEALDRHIQGHKDKVVQFKGGHKEYLEFFKYFGQRVITEILSSKDEFIAKNVLNYHWSKSDRNWQINLSNLQSEKDNKITYYWLNIMLEYIYETWKEKVFYNSYKKLEFKDIRKVNILINAFVPDINPEPFMQITELWFWRKEANAVQMYIENRVFTGVMSNVEVLSFDYNTTEEEEKIVWKKRNEEQIQKAIDIIIKIYSLNKSFCENMENQINKINRNELDDNKLYRLDSLQKTIESIAERFKKIL